MTRNFDHESESRESLARLWSQAEGTIQAFVFSAIRDFGQAEDVVQEVALSVAKRFPEYDPSRPFVGWALWLAKSKIVDHYRKQGRERRAFSDLVLDRITEVMVRRQPAQPARQTALEHCIEKLPEKSRRLLDLRYAESGSAESIARATGSTAGSVRVMLHRVREALADCIRSQLATWEGSG
ncbi:MAG: sigma-70 family RNA polymerase sigma factor [Phycisphaerae bacterium]|nr:sigma-70 family RNA polymerase sigma factor [Tepidisphaeraceae bacterium]